MVCYWRGAIYHPVGVVDPDIECIARLGADRYHNAARNLHRFVHSNGKTLPVPVSTCSVVIRAKKKGKRFEKATNYPILKLKDWMQVLLGSCGSEFLLAGYQVFEKDKYTVVFSRFWDRFRTRVMRYTLEAQRSGL